VLLYFPSTKTRPLLANRPWWTAVGRVDDESVYLVSRSGAPAAPPGALHGPADFVFTRAPDDGRHYTRTAFTDILRYRLVGAARHLGIDIDVKAFSGISFRKGSL
jgi:hypothetical protein